MNPSPFERNTFWSVSIGSLFYWISQHAVHPGAMQRFIAVSSLQKAKGVMLWSFVGFVVIKVVIILEGLLLYATFHDCDPLATKMVKKSGQLLPYYVIQVAKDYPGLTGLFISGVLSAALSTMSAKLNTVAGTIYEDFVKFFLKGKRLSEAKQAFSLKVITLILGIISICLVFVVEKLGALYQMVVTLNGFTSGSLVGIFSLGIFFPRANYKGAIAGALTSLVVMSGIISGSQLYIARGMLRFPGKSTSVEGCPAEFIENLGFNASARVQTYVGVGSPVVADASVPLIFQLSYWYYITLGTLVVLLVGLPVSYLTEPVDMKHLEPALFAPFVRQFLPQKQNFPVKPQGEEYKLVPTDVYSKDMAEPEADNKEILS
ncbi:sodium-coupled monocarboxylate transporter 1-like isoform X1 [Homalodisca vitripennis]|uniref:sodium-coupled monocarboxylate transporter 1-like isoform X1 n=1 Tax=Homalodisca vitripennis TaxID=197043 RepID=UPI001EEC602F|nr:sodium-coupled monocarboxylate transporter 1-like isoform X1 [Homalodisca vitripennis]